jgi:hypothetical protein
VKGPGLEAASIAHDVAVRVTACPAVAGLVGGPAGTYLPGCRVGGVTVRDRVIAVSVIARPEPLPDMIRQVRAAVRRAAPGYVVDVNVVDLAVPGTDDVCACQDQRP